MTRSFLVLFLCACAAKSKGTEEVPTPGATPGAAAPAAKSRSDVTHFIAPDATGIMKSSGEDFIILNYVSSILASPPPCWSKLRAAITAGYQIELRPSSYFIIEGNLPQREVEDCVTQAFAKTLPMTVDHDGDLVVFRSKAGVVYAKWNDGLIVAGSKEQIASAVAPAEARAQWAERLALLPSGKMAMWRSDGLIQNLLGVATSSYVMIVERVQKAPRPFFAARILARFGTAGDAAIAARRIKQGELAVPNAPAEIIAGVKLMKVKQNAETLEIVFDSDMFYGLDVAKLQEWAQQLAKP